LVKILIKNQLKIDKLNSSAAVFKPNGVAEKSSTRKAGINNLSRIVESFVNIIKEIVIKKIIFRWLKGNGENLRIEI
jgi:hypothetical protein